MADLTKNEMVEVLADVSNDAIPQMRDISIANMDEIMKEAMKQVQLQRYLTDSTRGTQDSISVKEYIEHHINFLVGVSQHKSKKDILEKLTIDHIQSMLKVTAKMDIVPEKVILKHLKTLKHKYK